MVCQPLPTIHIHLKAQFIKIRERHYPCYLTSVLIFQGNSNGISESGVYPGQQWASDELQRPISTVNEHSHSDTLWTSECLGLSLTQAFFFRRCDCFVQVIGMIYHPFCYLGALVRIPYQLDSSPQTIKVITDIQNHRRYKCHASIIQSTSRRFKKSYK